MMNRYICILVLLGWEALVCKGQQLSPLAGQGVPNLETTEVHLSAFLDRLLEVDAAKYMHESQFLIAVSWRDPTAAQTVQQNTEAVLNGKVNLVMLLSSNTLLHSFANLSPVGQEGTCFSCYFARL